jgi:hypothetical protein
MLISAYFLTKYSLPLYFIMKLSINAIGFFTSNQMVFLSLHI